jgi:hypothetical protein
MASKKIVPVKFTPKRREAYLRELATTGLKYHSAALSGVCNQTVLDHKEFDEIFAVQVEEALEVYSELVRMEVRRRAITGRLEPVFHQGSQGFTAFLDKHGNPVYEKVKVPERNEDGELTGKMKEIERIKMVPTFKSVVSDRLLELEVKRGDPSYRDKGQLDVNVTGGLLIVPGTAPTEKEWEDGT